MTDRLDVTTPNPADAGSGEVLASPFPEPEPISTDPSKGAKVGLGDKIFRGLSEGAGILIVVIIGAIGVFLLWRAIPALARNKENFFLFGGNWVTTDTSAMHFGILDLLYTALHRCQDHCTSRKIVKHPVKGKHDCDEKAGSTSARLDSPEIRQIHFEYIAGRSLDAIRKAERGSTEEMQMHVAGPAMGCGALQVFPRSSENMRKACDETSDCWVAGELTGCTGW